MRDVDTDTDTDTDVDTNTEKSMNMVIHNIFTLYSHSPIFIGLNSFTFERIRMASGEIPFINDEISDVTRPDHPFSVMYSTFCQIWNRDQYTDIYWSAFIYI